MWIVIQKLSLLLLDIFTFLCKVKVEFLDKKQWIQPVGLIHQKTTARTLIFPGNTTAILLSYDPTSGKNGLIKAFSWAVTLLRRKALRLARSLSVRTPIVRSLPRGPSPGNHWLLHQHGSDAPPRIQHSAVRANANSSPDASAVRQQHLCSA